MNMSIILDGPITKNDSNGELEWNGVWQFAKERKIDLKYHYEVCSHA